MLCGGSSDDGLKAIQSATWEGARLLRVEEKLGTLEATKLADVIAVQGNPLDDSGSPRAMAAADGRTSIRQNLVGYVLVEPAMRFSGGAVGNSSCVGLCSAMVT